MNRILITSTILMGVGMATDLFADHTRSAIQRDYEIGRVELANDYKARREALRYQYHRERDALRAERTQISRIDCPETRALRMRAINGELQTLSRDYAVSRRALARWYDGERDRLRDNYEQALRSVRVVRPVAVERPLSVDRIHTHPPGCECSVCSAHGHVVPPVAPHTCRPAPAFGYDDGSHIEPAGFRHDRRSIDWASLLFNLLAY